MELASCDLSGVCNFKVTPKLFEIWAFLNIYKVISLQARCGPEGG